MTYRPKIRIVAIYGNPAKSHGSELNSLKPFLKELYDGHNAEHLTSSARHLTSLVFDIETVGSRAGWTTEDYCPDYIVIVHKKLWKNTKHDIFRAAIIIHQRNADLRLIIYDPSKQQKIAT